MERNGEEEGGEGSERERERKGERGREEERGREGGEGICEIGKGKRDRKKREI